MINSLILLYKSLEVIDRHEKDEIEYSLFDSDEDDEFSDDSDNYISDNDIESKSWSDEPHKKEVKDFLLMIKIVKT